jgi:hypothetical protein
MRQSPSASTKKSISTSLVTNVILTAHSWMMHTAVLSGTGSTHFHARSMPTYFT